MWSSDDECDSIIESMNAKGFITCVVFMSDPRMLAMERESRGEDGYKDLLRTLRHKAQVFRAVSDANGMLQVAREVVKSSLKVGR